MANVYDFTFISDVIVEVTDIFPIYLRCNCRGHRNGNLYDLTFFQLLLSRPQAWRKHTILHLFQV